MILLLQLHDVTLIIRGLSFFLEQLVSILLTPLRHPFRNILTGDTYDEVDTVGINLRIRQLVFINAKPFGFFKTRLKGRIKRKIRRRISRYYHFDF